MREINRSPIYWLILGTLWSASLLISIIENDCKFSYAHILIGLLAVLSYAVAIYFIIKRRSPKNDHHEKDC